MYINNLSNSFAPPQLTIGERMSRITRLRRWCMLDDGSGLAPKPPPSSSRSGFRKLRRVISQPFIMQLRGSIASIWGRQIVGPIDNNAVFTGRIINRRSFYSASPPKTKQVEITVRLVANEYCVPEALSFPVYLF